MPGVCRASSLARLRGPVHPGIYDNSGSFRMGANPVTKPNRKHIHIDVRRHFLGTFVEKGKFNCSRVQSEFQQAGFMMKPLNQAAFRLYRNAVTSMS